MEHNKEEESVTPNSPSCAADALHPIVADTTQNASVGNLPMEAFDIMVHKDYFISSTLRLRKASSAAPFSIPFWSRARSMSWLTTLLPLA